jgi:hypothetical protein
MNSEFPELQQFLGGYFHQDFHVEYDSPDDAINAFKTDATPTQKQSVSEELRKVLSLLTSKPELEDTMLARLWCCYVPTSDGLTPHEWLNHVYRRLAE